MSLPVYRTSDTCLDRFSMVDLMEIKGQTEAIEPPVVFVVFTDEDVFAVNEEATYRLLTGEEALAAELADREGAPS